MVRFAIFYNGIKFLSQILIFQKNQFVDVPFFDGVPIILPFTMRWKYLTKAQNHFKNSILQTSLKASQSQITGIAYLGQSDLIILLEIQRVCLLLYDLVSAPV